MPQLAERIRPWLTAVDERPQGAPRWLQDLRDRAASRFGALGFPTVRDEDWRFTNISPIVAGEFRPAGPAPAAAGDLASIPHAGVGHRIVLVNGRFAPELSRLGSLPRGVRVASLASAVTEQADVVQRYFGQLADFGSRSFAALNSALASDGAFVHIADGLILEEALQIIFVAAPSGDARPMTSARVLVVAGERVQARIVETYAGPADMAYFTNAVTEIFAGENAVVDHYKVQQEGARGFHVASMHVHAARAASFTSHSFSLGARIARNDAIVLLDGEGAECTLNGLYLADGERLVDNHTMIDHARPHCPSHEIYKGILGGSARAVFNGKIVVRPDAQKTDAKQTNRALLLSDNASINTKPQLEIFADDVKCTHGAAIGQLDDDAIFYLRSRGLPYFEARDMLIRAFAGDILDRVKIPELRAGLEQELYSQLAKDLEEIDRQ
ncbi:MAG: Fe-S cluster assembly protein SufD [Acidobacteria bacterium RIFCSPLOWO2_12_FULL_66_21]|nr:MAG: Fe-S cluster assembly protein SufD [Acidobacteria bacterium RIFCSPLOWO2_12_FULL_66_21]